MPDYCVADLFQIGSRFLRSVQLERDFTDPNALKGYVLTDFSKKCFNRIAEGLDTDSSRRAWRITGDYGSGKSSFALLLASAIADKNAVPQHIAKELNLPKRLNYTPILCTCSRQSLGMSVIKALHEAAESLYSKGNRPKFIQSINDLLDSRELQDEQVISVIENFNSKIIADGKSKGLLLLIDELGKFLEYAAINPTTQDVFLLQRIAEFATRSKSHPFMIVCLLHQGFNAYAEHLNQQAQREWEKIAGRFEEIVFNQPIEQIAYLIASSLGVKTNKLFPTDISTMKKAMKHSLNLSWFGVTGKNSMMDLAERLYPIHPMVIPVLIRIFRRFGQNERSLFSFLLSSEPYGLQAFCSRNLQESRLYGLYDFYDYVRVNFGHRISVHSYRSHWNLIESVIESYSSEEPLQIQILKTVGILNLLNDDLLVNEEAVLCAMTTTGVDSKENIRKALEVLRQNKRVLYDRGRARGFCLWPHTSVDIEKAYDETRSAVLKPQRVSSQISEYLDEMPVVARRHYIETGNLRHFSVNYCSVDEMPDIVKTGNDADGFILVPLCETESERDRAISFAKGSELRERQNWLIAIPQPLCNIGSLIHEVQRWEWVASNVVELNGDKYAREEVSRQLLAARQHLHANIQTRVGIKNFSGNTTLIWLHKGQKINITDTRKLLCELSKICDSVYPDAPHIQNELVNRRNISTAAASARMRLIERMFSGSNLSLLGMDPVKKPPEMSMYLSVLKNTGIHSEHNGIWQIREPSSKQDEKCHMLPTLKKVRHLLRQTPDSRVNVASIFSELRQPPYGVRDGLMPLFLTIFAIVHEHDVAFYKDGTFIREMGAEIMLELTKAPERFEIQYCRIEGVRTEIFKKLLDILDIKPKNEYKTELLDVVKPLCVFVAQLPAYVHNTKKMTSCTIAVRDVIMNAHEPLKLLFTELPKACGNMSFSTGRTEEKDIQAFIKKLKASIDELRAAYPDLHLRMKKAIRDVFDIPGTFQQFRNILAERAQQTLLGINEPKLKAFSLRLMDDNLPESEWLESLGSFLALKPPSKWIDLEEELFNTELAQLAKRFKHVESIVFAKNKPARGAVGIRVSITQANGNECEKVIHYSADEENRVRELQTQFAAILTRDKRLALAAASRAIWAEQEKGEL